MFNRGTPRGRSYLKCPISVPCLEAILKQKGDVFNLSIPQSSSFQTFFPHSEIVTQLMDLHRHIYSHALRMGQKLHRTIIIVSGHTRDFSILFYFFKKMCWSWPTKMTLLNHSCIITHKGKTPGLKAPTSGVCCPELSGRMGTLQESRGARGSRVASCG